RPRRGARRGGGAAGRRAADLEPVSAVLFPGGRRRGEQRKVLDTSVIIDGRIADVCETGFIEGTLVVPQFVLQELQHIADSSDTLRRARGRGGFEVVGRVRRVAEGPGAGTPARLSPVGRGAAPLLQPGP